MLSSMPNFRDHLIAASLKQGQLGWVIPASNYFRDHLIAASLKPEIRSLIEKSAQKFPRSFDRGFIEAGPQSQHGATPSAHFRDHLIAASLKLEPLLERDDLREEISAII